MVNPAALDDSNTPPHALAATEGRVVLDFENSSVKPSTIEENSEDFGIFVDGSSFGSRSGPWFLPDAVMSVFFASESSASVVSTGINWSDSLETVIQPSTFARSAGQAVLDFESSTVIMPLTNEENQTFNSPIDPCLLENDMFDRCIQTNVDRNFRQQAEVDDMIGGARRCYGKRRTTGQCVLGRRAVSNNFASDNSLPNGVSSLYMDISDCQWSCEHCSAKFWHRERLKGYSKDHKVRYHKCCLGGKVILEDEHDPPAFLKQLFGNRLFLENIRAYNQMFSMTSFGAHVDESINNGRGPYIFKISGQIYHWIGTLCPFVGDPSRLFRTARDKCNERPVPDFKIRLYSVVDAREYDLPTSQTLGAIVFESGQNTETDYDPGFHIEMKQQTTAGEKRLSMNMFYMYQLHERFDSYGLLFRAGRLFQQYVVGVYCCIEQNRTDYYRQHQADIRKDYLSGIYDAISRGYHEGYEIGSRIILPMSFTSGPRYMYSHYLDALAICRVLGNPQYFITFRCNVNWPEIKRHMEEYPELLPGDRADIVVCVFQQKVNDFCNYLTTSKLFGAVTGLKLLPLN
ncbi:DNA helicase [Tanacetum coccineum]